MKTLPIHECFFTFQGEGVHMGRPAFFIRTFGCPVHCPWCDSAGTWHPDFIPKDIARKTIDDLRIMVQESKAKTIVITGGEPAIHDLGELTRVLQQEEGCNVHLETSGAFPLRNDFDWVTLSPKRWKLPLMANVVTADEFKIIVSEAEDIPYYWKVLKESGLYSPYNHKRRPIWLHPEWSKRDDPQVLGAICDMVKSQVADFRAGWQIHKLYKVDLKDPGSRTAVPLGGNPKLGF